MPRITLNGKRGYLNEKVNYGFKYFRVNHCRGRLWGFTAAQRFNAWETRQNVSKNVIGEFELDRAE